MPTRNEFLYNTSVEIKDYNAQDVQDITVACSNESDYKSNPFTAVEEAEAVKAEEPKDDEAPADELF